MCPANSDSDSTAETTTHPIALLVQPSKPTLLSIDATLATHGFEILITEELPDAFDRAALLLVEADRGGRAFALSRLAHELCPELPIVGVLNWWNEDERLFDGIADLIVHVPLREDQVAALERFATTVAQRCAGAVERHPATVNTGSAS